MFRQKFLTVTLLVAILSVQFIPHASASAAGQCDWFKFVADVTISSGTSLPPGAPFVKTWRLQNIGTCTWTSSYSLAHYNGERMSAVNAVTLDRPVAPGETVDISVNMTAPLTGGLHEGTWLMSNASGARFLIGQNASMPVWVTIFVIENNMVAFDFVANAPYAQWKSGAGLLPYPGTSGDSRGYALKLEYPHLEDGSFDPQPGLLTVPQNKYDGYIQATYPEFIVQQGDRLQTTVNCEYGATGCYATFRVDYMTSTGAVRTLWKFPEKYEGKVYRANVSLDVLAGQKVKFILMTLGTGPASGDRALWGSPRIVRAGNGTPPPPPTVTLLPPLTPTATPFINPPTIPAGTCDKAAFVADIRVPDGTFFSPGAAFTKTWRLRNSGSCTWTSAYSLVFYSGDQMGAPTTVNFPSFAVPGQTIDLTVNMVAPSTAGEHRGFWILRNASGALFGIGRTADSPFWVEINVSGETPSVSGYDFEQNACAAEWKSGSGPLPCPGMEGDGKGFVIPLNYTRLEDGTMGPAPSLLLATENKYNGYIQGMYPAFTVQPGDRFHAGVGCEFGYSCYVTFRLDYMTSTGSVHTFWTRREQNEGQNHSIDLSLTPLVGQSVRFILTVLATGSAANDRIRWIGPYIVRMETPTLPSLTPEQTGLVIRGRVTKDGAGLPNVRIYRSFASYPGILAATTDANGYYQSDFWYIPGDEMVTVWAEQQGYSFTPPNTFWRHYHSREDLTLNFTASDAVTATPFLGDWLGYTNLKYGFKFKYPPRLEDQPNPDPNHARIDLSFAPGTNLTQKYVEVTVVENANPCQSPRTPYSNLLSAENVTINGIPFLKQTGMDAGMSKLNDWVSYSTLKGNACISMDFVLHSVNAIDPPPPVFDKAAESIVFGDIMFTFGWLEVTETPSPTPTQTPSPISTLPDLTIVDVHYELKNVSCLLAGDVFGVRVWVKNQGQAAAGSFTVRANEAQTLINGLGIGETTVVFFPGMGNTITVTVDASSSVTESDETNNSFSGSLAVPTPPLPCTVTPTLTPSPTPSATQTQPALTGPYAVILVAPGDVLNIRSGPGVGNPVIGSFARNAVNVMRTGPIQQVDGADWVEVLMPDGANKGWVNFKYLSEYVSRESFCADARIAPLIVQLKQAVSASNGALLAPLVSPKHGLNLNYWASSETVNYTSASVQTVFTDPQIIHWGSGGGSGVDDSGTFAQVVQPQLADVLNSAYQSKCDEIVYGSSYTNVMQYADTNIHFYSVIKPPTNVMDWKVWLVRIEYVNGQPYLFGAVHYVWEP